MKSGKIGYQAHEGYHSKDIDIVDIQAAMSAIDKKEKQINQDVEYNLARLEGQLARAQVILQSLDGMTYSTMAETLTNAKSFLSALRKSLEHNRYDVT